LKEGKSSKKKVQSYCAWGEEAAINQINCLKCLKNQKGIMVENLWKKRKPRNRKKSRKRKSRKRQCECANEKAATEGYGGCYLRDDWG